MVPPSFTNQMFGLRWSLLHKLLLLQFTDCRYDGAVSYLIFILQQQQQIISKSKRVVVKCGASDSDTMNVTIRDVHKQRIAILRGNWPWVDGMGDLK